MNSDVANLRGGAGGFSSCGEAARLVRALTLKDRIGNGPPGIARKLFLDAPWKIGGGGTTRDEAWHRSLRPRAEQRI